MIIFKAIGGDSFYIDPESIAACYTLKFTDKERAKIELKDGSSYIVDETIEQVIEKYKSAGFGVWGEEEAAG